MLHHHHHAKTIKGLIPPFVPLDHGKGARNRSMCCGPIAHDAFPHIISLYYNSTSLTVADLTAERTLTVFGERDGGDVMRVAVQSGFIVIEQLSSLVLADLVSSKRVTFRYTTPFWWYLEEHCVIVVNQFQVTKIRLSSTFDIVSQRDVNLTKAAPIENPTIVQSDRSKGTVLIVWGGKLQVWNMSFPTLADENEPIGNLIFEGYAPKRHAISAARMFGDTIASITPAGDFVELWRLIGGNSSQEAYVSLRQETMATSIHLDELYLIVGHIDGSLDVYDRIHGKKTRLSSADVSAGTHDHRVLYVDRAGKYIFTVTTDCLTIRRIDDLAPFVLHKAPIGTRFESGFLDRTSKVLFAVQVSPGQEGVPVAEAVHWRPKFKDLNKKEHVSSAVCVEVHIDPSVQVLSQKPIEEWSRSDVASFVASMGLIELKPNFYAANVDGVQLSKITQQRLLELGMDAAAVRKKFANAVSKIVNRTPDEADNPISGSRPASELSDFDGPPSRSNSGNKLLRSANSSDSMNVQSGHKLHVSMIRAGSSDSIGPVISRQSSGNLTGSSGPPSKENSPRRSLLEPTTPRSPRPASPKEIVKPSGHKLIVICHLADSEESVTLRFFDLRIRMETLRSLLEATLEAEGLKSIKEVATIVVPTQQGYLPLVEQSKLDAIVDEATKDGSATIRLTVKKHQAQETSQRFVADMFQAHEFLIAQTKPCFIVEAANLNVIAVNALVQQSLGFTLPCLVNKSFDKVVVMPVPEFSLEKHLADLKTEDSVTEWATVLVKKDETFQRGRLSASKFRVGYTACYLVCVLPE